MDEIFKFLEENRTGNKDFQEKEYRRSLASCTSGAERLKQHLHSTVNSQSQPNLTNLAKFWRKFEKNPWGKKPPTLDQLCSFLELGKKQKYQPAGPWHRLFLALSAMDGWGDKTAALFVKSTIRIHRGLKLKKLHFLSDPQTARKLHASDRIYLPVDKVILFIFEECAFEKGNPASPTFKSINASLLERYSPEQMLIWDDLWYWGHFTQKVEEKKRTLKWNLDKFWCQASTDKANVAEVKVSSRSFIKLLRGRAY